jgi:hypothetical protein
VSAGLRSLPCRGQPPHARHRHIPRLQPRVKNLINGKFVDSKTDRWIPVHDPSTNEVVALTPQSTQAEVRAMAWQACRGGSLAGGPELAAMRDGLQWMQPQRVLRA